MVANLVVEGWGNLDRDARCGAVRAARVNGGHGNTQGSLHNQVSSGGSRDSPQCMRCIGVRGAAKDHSSSRCTLDYPP